MSEVDTVDAIRYGGSLIVYLIAIYFGGGIISLIGFAVMGAGAGGPFSSGNPLLVLIGVLFIIGGYVVVIAGSLGIGYKVIVDGVARGVDSSSTAERILARD